VTLSLIVAMAENRVIGRENGLPWHLPADLKRFKQLTMGRALLMGRRTFLSIGRPLPGRRMIVLSRSRNLAIAGVEVVGSLDQALALVATDPEVFVVGGAELYRATLPRADRLYLTLVHATPEGDVTFPPFNWAAWTLVDEQRHQADEHHAYAFTLRRYDRIATKPPAR